MKIRQAVAKDATKLSRLIRSIIASTSYYTPRARKEEIKKYIPRTLADCLEDKKYYYCLLAEDEPRLIGFALGRNEAGVFWGDWVGVRKDVRRDGVAEALMRRWERDLPNRSVHKIWCDTRASNKESVSLLRKLGYKKLGTFRNGWYKQDFFLWEKDLP